MHCFCIKWYMLNHNKQTKNRVKIDTWWERVVWSGKLLKDGWGESLTACSPGLWRLKILTSTWFVPTIFLLIWWNKIGLTCVVVSNRGAEWRRARPRVPATRFPVKRCILSDQLNTKNQIWESNIHLRVLLSLQVFWSSKLFMNQYLSK